MLKQVNDNLRKELESKKKVFHLTQIFLERTEELNFVKKVANQQGLKNLTLCTYQIRKQRPRNCSFKRCLRKGDSRERW